MTSLNIYIIKYENSFHFLTIYKKKFMNTYIALIEKVHVYTFGINSNTNNTLVNKPIANIINCIHIVLVVMR